MFTKWKVKLNLIINLLSPFDEKNRITLSLLRVAIGSYACRENTRLSLDPIAFSRVYANEFFAYVFFIFNRERNFLTKTLGICSSRKLWKISEALAGGARL